MYEVPILLLIFNRPEETQQVFNVVKKRMPKYLYIAADGPRDAFEALLCEKCREIIKEINWDCELKTLFRDENLGCGEGPANAITWFFNEVNEGIILEDDCLPNESFFNYCEDLLIKYRHKDNIKMICGTSYQAEPLDENSYYFSKYVHVWGWASWRRAWNEYNYSIQTETNENRSAVVDNTFANKRERKLWKYNLGIIVNGLDAWDYQWMYWIWKNDGLSIIPWKNTISNIGFGTKATHTHDEASNQSKMAQYEIINIKHPLNISLHRKADKFERYKILIPKPMDYYKSRLKSACKKLLRIISF